MNDGFDEETGESCEDLPQKDCKDIPDSISCEWNSAQKKCLPRFIERCNAWLNDPAQNDCSTKLSTDEENTFDTEPIKSFLNKCTSIRWFRRGHSNDEQCGPFSKTIMVCVKCAGTCCTDIDMRNAGCSTFANMDSARKYMKQVQKTLRPGLHVTIHANQATSDTESQCLSYANFDMTEQCWNEPTFDPCPPANKCYPQKPPETIQCTQNGQLVKRTCCPVSGSSSSAGTWIPGATCPATR